MLFSRAGLNLALSLVISVSARPAEKRWGGLGSWAGGMRSSKASRHMDFGKRFSEDWGSCDLNAAYSLMTTKLGDVSPSLPQPQSGLQLYTIALGRGTQNYTCDLTNTTAVPTAIGAYATLFNVSCIASNFPPLLDFLPGLAANMSIPQSSLAEQDVLGHHYFLNDTTPFFNLDTDLHQYGMGALAKANASDAPASSQGGVYGPAVQWLKLDAQPLAAEDQWKQVYRLNTAGGSAPALCTDLEQPKHSFTVDYAAIYWLFK